MLEIRLCAAIARLAAMAPVAAIALVAGCGRQQGEAPAKEHTRLEGEIALFFGDCAPPTTRFVSGPEPQAFGELRAATSLYATMSPGGDVVAGFDVPARGDVPTGGDVSTGGDVPAGGVRQAGASATDKLAAPTTESATGKLAAPTSATDKLATSNTATGKLAAPTSATDKLATSNTVADKLPAPRTATITDKLPAPPTATATDKLAAPTSASAAGKLAAPTSATDKLAAPNTVADKLPTPPTATITDKLATPNIVASAHYLPGASSPLASLRLALIDCFREQDQRMGVAVFDLAPKSITSHGIDNAAFTKCIAELAPQVSVKEPVRCSASFGSALLPELPHIDLKVDGVFIGDKRVDVKDTDEWWKVEPIYSWSTDRVRTTLTSSAPIVLHGPVIVRPAAETPMRVVTRLVHTLIAAGDDPMLAADRSGVWLPLHPRNLPVVPVPIGTGGSWNSDKAKLVVPRISVLVGKQQLWIDGVAVTDEKTELAAAQLRGPVEIAAQGEVPYGRLVEVIDELGGSDWSLTSGRALAKPPNREQPHIERTTRHDVRGAPISK